MRVRLRALLQAHGHTVTEASNGVDALELTRGRIAYVNRRSDEVTGVAHDFNNLLTQVIGHTHLALPQLRVSHVGLQQSRCGSAPRFVRRVR